MPIALLKKDKTMTIRVNAVVIITSDGIIDKTVSKIMMSMTFWSLPPRLIATVFSDGSAKTLVSGIAKKTNIMLKNETIRLFLLSFFKNSYAFSSFDVRTFSLCLLVGRIICIVLFLSCFFAEKSRYLTIDDEKIVLPRGTIINEKTSFSRTIINTNKICGAEALVRWLHPEKGLIPPIFFLPYFERCGFITELDYYVLECTCQNLRRWIDQGIKVVPVSCNFSRLHAKDDFFPEKVQVIADMYNIPHHLLEIEITDAEAKAMIDPMAEQNKLLGNEKGTDYLYEGGVYHMNGNQALAYSRIRKR